jgi:predicted hotdog family 3-hydroxylacyl-ACP dehydratase
VLDRPRILALIPHQGSMCLLDAAVAWDESYILCHSRSHLAAENPLRREGRLSAIAGIEYGLQAMALHGAILEGSAPDPPGLLARLRDVELHVDRLDDPALGTLAVEARLERKEAGGMVYRFSVHSAARVLLLAAQGMIILPTGTDGTGCLSLPVGGE